MKIPVIVDAIRTPMGKSKGGIFRNIRSEKLGSHVVQSILDRNPSLDPSEVDEVVFGCANQQKEQGFNIARFISLLTDIPAETSSKTINFLCGSSLEAINDASRQIMIGEGKAFVCGGVEHMGHIPMDCNYDENPEFCLTSARASQVMGYTTEYLSIVNDVSREDQDEFSCRSHMKAANSEWNEIIPTPAHNYIDGSYFLCDYDEPVRADTSVEKLAELMPVFNPEGTVTAGNSSSISDGVAALLVLEKEYAISLGFPESTMVEVKAFNRSGVSPAIMGYGPVPAITNLLETTLPSIHDIQLSLDDIDVIEINEAFAAQALVCIRDLGLDDKIDDMVNLKGGAIALGHPLGCSGARITTTLYHQMIENDLEFGIATMCVGLGQGAATLFHRASS